MDWLSAPFSVTALGAWLLLNAALTKQPHFRPWINATVSFGLVLALDTGFAIRAAILFLLSFTFLRSKRSQSGPYVLAAVLVVVGFWTIERHLLPVGVHAVAPVGLSYFAFRWIQLFLDRYRKTLGPTSFAALAEFIFFVPTWAAGPVEVFQQFRDNRAFSINSACVVFGIRRILWGLFKKLVGLELLLAGFGWETYRYGVLIEQDVLLRGTAAAFLVLTYLRIYLDLSAYSDLAIGLSALFGLRIMENFDRPLLRTDLGAFWRSWHRSVAGWCRANVYFPVFGVTRAPWIGLYASMIVMGIWHEVNANWLLWGLYHSTGLVVVARWDKFKRKRKTLKRLTKTPGYLLCAWALTFCFVTVGYAFAGTDSANQMSRVLGALIFGRM